MKRTEYRVVWERAGLTRRSARYRSEDQARRKVLVLQGRMQEATGEDPDDFACCSGYECGCRGVSKGQAWAERSAVLPPLVFGPVVHTRTFEATPWVEA